MRRALQKFAELTGGQAYFPESLTEIEGLCRRIAHDLRSQYTIGYTPTNKNHDGSWREVTVTVDSYPDRQLIGSVMKISAESEFTPRNVQSIDERRHQVFGIKIRVANPEGIFKSGMAAEVTFKD